MKKILILNGQYAPGYKGGGPIRSCLNMVENLKDEFEFYVICSDRDYGEKESYKNIEVDKWTKVGGAMVYYCSPQNTRMFKLNKIINSIEYNALYLNGYFSPIFTIRPLLLRKLGFLNNESKVILTPRGDFTGGCENKKIKKYTYIYFTQIVGLYKNILWHATSEMEGNDIKTKFRNADIVVTSNLSEKYIVKECKLDKKENELRLVFISRIFPKKNLKYALEILKEIEFGNIIFDIYGPMEDEKYWRECERIIEKIPSNVQVKYCGELSHSEIANTFQKYHAFLFPTLGENYGHVIVEAMMNNCMCILSKGVTPWDDYIEMLGMGSELSNHQTFVEIINKLIKIDNSEMKKYINATAKYIDSKTNTREKLTSYIDEIFCEI